MKQSASATAEIASGVLCPLSLARGPKKQNLGRPRFCGCNDGAGNETRTRDPDLGKVVLYQLSYSRIRPRMVRMAPGVSIAARMDQRGPAVSADRHQRAES